ncbi:unnamed protein product, partial [Prorocentrum cordatum]
ALGNLPPGNADIMNVTDWAPGSRQRTLLASFPPAQPEDLPATQRIAPPWGPRWAFRHDGIVPTWTWSRGDQDEFLVSTYQTGVRHLLYDLDHEQRWFLGNLES